MKSITCEARDVSKLPMAPDVEWLIDDTAENMLACPDERTVIAAQRGAASTRITVDVDGALFEAVDVIHQTEDPAKLAMRWARRARCTGACGALGS